MTFALRIPLDNTEFEGANNAYLLKDGTATALVDTGVAVDAARRPLLAALVDAGVDVGNVDAIFLTHWHPDHAGLAGDLQDESGATVYAHPGDADLIERTEAAFEAIEGQQERYFEEWGIPGAKREELWERLAGEGDLSGNAAEVTRVEAGEEVEVGETTLRVVPTPGHTAGHVAYEFKSENGLEAFAGDALLPRYTPNVGGADVRVDRPIAVYVDTLEALRDRGYDRVLPGHRTPIDSPAERAREIIDHHRDRAERVVDIVAAEGPVDAWSVSQRLFGEVHGIHILHGPGESYAHLNQLTHQGVLSETDGEYEVVEMPADRDIAEWV